MFNYENKIKGDLLEARKLLAEALDILVNYAGGFTILINKIDDFLNRTKS